MSNQETIAVEVAYALPDKQAIVPVLVPVGATALEAAHKSRIAEQFEGLEISDDLKLGIFGKAVSPGQVLREGDRVEIYRPLKADPKEVRKARAAAARERRSTSS
jgi:putative ubiquitin-RnfH superfamily antitoxin RatB of RatAB toxin-antitoxin module